MPLTRPAPIPRRARLAAALSMAAAAAEATQDFSIVVGTCAASNLATLQNTLVLINGGVQRAGRDPPGRSSYMCGVPLDDLAEVPSWDQLELQFRDDNSGGNGHVSARLMRKSLATGAAILVAKVESVPSTTVKTLRVALPRPLDFRRYAYYVIVEVWTPLEVVVAHQVRLTTAPP